MVELMGKAPWMLRPKLNRSVMLGDEVPHRPQRNDPQRGWAHSANSPKAMQQKSRLGPANRCSAGSFADAGVPTEYGELPNCRIDRFSMNRQHRHPECRDNEQIEEGDRGRTSGAAPRE